METPAASPSTVSPSAVSPSQALDALPDRLSMPSASVETDEKPGHKTRGEKWFDGLAYAGLAGGGTFLLSVGSMYLMKYGEGKAGFGLSNKSWKESWDLIAERFAKAGMWKSLANTQLGKTKAFNFLHDEKNLQRTAQRVLETTALGIVGGTTMMFPVEQMERRKKGIVHWLNTKLSTPEEVALGDARVKDEPPQTLGTLIKGRATAFTVGFIAITGTDILLAKGAKMAVRPNSSKALKELAADGLGALSNWSGQGVENLYTKISPNAPQVKKTFWNRIGNISAVDAVATVASTIILYVSSKFFSAQLSKKHGLKHAAEQGGVSPLESNAPAITGETPEVIAARTGVTLKTPEPAAPETITPTPEPIPGETHAPQMHAPQTHAPQTHENIAARTGITLKNSPKPREESFVAARQSEKESAQTMELAR